jgi:integrase
VSGRRGQPGHRGRTGADLHGAHDFRHTCAIWLEDAGIPARVIDELMGHEATGRSGQQRGSAIGAHYRHTTPEMAAQVVDAIQQRLAVVVKVAEQDPQGFAD